MKKLIWQRCICSAKLAFLRTRRPHVAFTIPSHRQIRANSEETSGLLEIGTVTCLKYWEIQPL